jgi:3-oxoacyl-[acyl-carrier-protein] synthase III
MSRAAVICGLGAWVPPRVVTNAMLAQTLDTSDEWIRARTGIRQRHVIDPGMTTGDLAVEAAGRALKSAGRSRVDHVILATTTPDRRCPATAPTVASRLGLDRVPAYDISAVCTGFLYGLSCAVGAIASRQADTVLVVAAETFTTLLDPADRATAAIFGDGAGAVVLRAGDPQEPGAIRRLHLGSDGQLADLITVAGGGPTERSQGEPIDPYFRMQGPAVFHEAVTRMTEATRTVVAQSGWSMAEVDRLVGHQANARILAAVAEHLDLDAEVAVVTIAEVGNTAGASIPLALNDAALTGVLREGNRTVLTAFGGGATWGAVSLVWPDVDPG